MRPHLIAATKFRLLRSIGAGSAIVVLLVSRIAFADPPPAERAIAERLYERGQQQLADGQVAAACESFAESFRIDPGTGTLLTLASCHETEGKLASAWVEFREAVVTLRREARPDRVRFANDRLAAIEPRLGHVTINVAEGSPRLVPVVALNGRELGRAAWGLAIPVDAGRIEVTARFGPGDDWRLAIQIRDGEHRVFTVPARHSAAANVSRDPSLRPELHATPNGLRAKAPTPTPTDLTSEHAIGRRQIVAIALGGAGVVSLGIGSYLGLRAASLWGDRNQQCPMEACTPDGLALGARADSAATAATWTMVGGVVALAGAALVLFLPRQSATEQRPSHLQALQSLGVSHDGRVFIGGVF
jgi:hypothetical protein